LKIAPGPELRVMAVLVPALTLTVVTVSALISKSMMRSRDP
jgi:hypothetical protein